MISILTTILAIKSDSQVSIEAEDINQITWIDNNPTNITKEQILAKQTELQAEYDSKNYQRNRAAEYPSLKEFAEAYCEKEINGNDTKWLEYKTKYNKVRTDNPKS